MKEDGVWRTVGGRRIFIKEGEDLSTAMKNSGKFKGTKKKSKESEKSKEEDLYNEYKKHNEILEKLDKASKEDKETQTYKDLRKDVENKKHEAFNKMKEYYNKSREGKIESQTDDIEKASGLKVEESFETDLYGNGKEDRFELEDGRIVSHTTEAFGKEVDKWSVSKFENGSMNSKTFDSYDQMINHLSRGEQGYGTSYKKYFDEHPKASFEDFERDYMKKLKSSK